MIEFSSDSAKALRAKLGISQQQMAELAGYTANNARQNWAAIEAGRQGMDAARWELLLLKAGQHPTLTLTSR